MGESPDGPSLQESSLALFLDRGISLADWDEWGIFEREVTLYDRLSDEFDTVYLFTFGSDDSRYEARLADDVEVVQKRHFENDFLYALLLVVIQRSVLKQVDIVKTNQMKAALHALLVSVFYDVALVIRTGFVPSSFARQKCHLRSRFNPAYYLMLKDHYVAAGLEKLAYAVADGAITSSAQGFLYLESHHWIRATHVVIPNYVDTELFSPDPLATIEPESVCFVGRLMPQKNVEALVAALAPRDLTLTIVGSGYLDDRMREIAAGSPLELEFRGRVPNPELPALLNEHEMFVLPSHFEGMPKVLLEAMACGRPVVATDVQGSNEVVDHGADGLLARPSPESIRESIDRLRDDEALRERLGAAAREKVETHYRLDSIVERERSLYEGLLTP